MSFFFCLACTEAIPQVKFLEQYFLSFHKHKNKIFLFNCAPSVENSGPYSLLPLQTGFGPSHAFAGSWKRSEGLWGQSVEVSHLWRCRVELSDWLSPKDFFPQKMRWTNHVCTTGSLSAYLPLTRNISEHILAIYWRSYRWRTHLKRNSLPFRLKRKSTFLYPPPNTLKKLSPWSTCA